jgi:hypothetical protein
MTDGSVGPRSIVAWRHRAGSGHKEGSGHLFYTGTSRDANTPSLPSISNGLDVHAMVTALAPHMEKFMQGKLAGKVDGELDTQLINAVLARLPSKPDQHLR